MSIVFINKNWRTRMEMVMAICSLSCWWYFKLRLHRSRPSPVLPWWNNIVGVFICMIDADVKQNGAHNADGVLCMGLEEGVDGVCFRSLSSRDPWPIRSPSHLLTMHTFQIFIGSSLFMIFVFVRLSVVLPRSVPQRRLEI